MKTRAHDESAIVNRDVVKREPPDSSFYGLLPSAIMGASKSEPPDDKDDKDDKPGLAVNNG